MSDNLANRILTQLPSRELAFMRTHLAPITLEAGDVLYSSGQHIDRVYFPETFVVAMLIELPDGRAVQAAAVGEDGVVGVGGSLAEERSFTTQRILRSGDGFVLKYKAFAKILEDCEPLQTIVQVYRDAFSAHLLQSIACNAAHRAPERLARWLLELRDLTSEPRLPFTHEALALMVGCNRPTVTLGVRTLEEAGVLKTGRGWVEIVDRAGLQAFACPCYSFIRGAYGNLHSKKIKAKAKG